MVKSLFVTASAGSGKTFCLTKEVRRHIECDTTFVVAATFTRAAAAEMEKRILEEIEKGPESATEKLRLIMRAAKVHFSTIDALFHQFLTNEEYVPQVADDHERALIAASADERFFQHPLILADIESILIAARIFNLQPESLINELDKRKETLAAWECPDTRLDELMRRTGAYRRQIREVAGAGAGLSRGNEGESVQAGGRAPAQTDRGCGAR